MVHVTAANTIGQFGQNLLQGSSLGMFRREAEAQETEKSGAGTMMVSSRSRTSRRKPGLMCTGRSSWLWQEPLQKAVSLHRALWHSQMTKPLFHRGLDLPVSIKPANPTSWSQIRHHPSSQCTTSVCRFPKANLFASFYFCQINLFPEA